MDIGRVTLSAVVAGALLLTVNLVFADVSSLLFFNVSSQTDSNPNTIAASSTGPPDWDFGTTKDAFYLARDGLGINEQANSTSSALYNNNVTQISLELAKVNNPRGNLTVGVWNEAGTLLNTFATVNASTLSSSATNYDYTLPGGIILDDGDRLGVQYTDNSSNSRATFTTPMNITSGTGEFTLHGATSTIHAEKVPSTNSPLYNQDTNSIIVRLKTTGTPTGILEACIYNSTGNCVFQFGTRDITQISTTGTDFLFYNASAKHTLAVNDYIGIKFTGGDASNNLKVVTDSANPYNGTTTFRSSFNSGIWTDNTTVDMRMIVTNVTFPSSAAHWSLDFDGVDDYAFLPTKNIFANQTTNFTIIVWLKPDVFKTMTIIGNFREGNDGWALETDTDNRPTFKFRSTTGTGSDRIYNSRYQIVKGEEHFVALIYNGTHTKFRINEQWDDRQATGSHAIKNNDVQILRVGDRAYSGGEFWDGSINQLQIWNRTLSDTEVIDAYNGIQPSSSNLILDYRFDAGSSVIIKDETGNYHAVRVTNADAKINPPYESTSAPNFIRVGLDNTAEFDNTGTLNDPIRGKKFTWVVGINDDLTNLSIDTHTVLNRTMLYDMKNRGVDFVILGGVNNNFNGGHAIYPNVWIPWINLAHQEGLQIYAASLENTIYLHSSWTDEMLQDTFQDIITPAGPYFDGWTINIEPINLSNFTANKAYYLERWMNVTNILGGVATANGEIYYPTIENTNDDADIASLTIYTNGIDDLNSDGIIIEAYQLNSTIINNKISPIITARTLPQFYLISLRDTGGSNKHNMEEWEQSQILISNYNATYDHVWGVGGYSSSAFIDKTDTVFVKHTLMSKYNGTGYKDDQRDIAGSIVTVNTQPASLANDDNTTTYWQNGVQGGAGEYIEATTDLQGVRTTITAVQINKPDVRTIPQLVDIYVDGALALNNHALIQSTGVETIDINDRAGDTARIQVDTLGTANSFKVAEFDLEVDVTTSQYEGNDKAEDAANSTETNTWLILNIASFGVLFGALFTIFGKFGFE